jgi:hypothetical protein
VDKALINNDGYWVRSSDYSLYEDPKGKSHVIPQDANETLREVEMMGGRGRGGPGGPGGGGGRGASGGPSGIALDPFANSEDPEKALYRLLQVPALRAKYLGYVRDIAEKWLDWKTLGPLAEQFHSVIATDIKLDTKKLDTTENFAGGVTKDRVEEPRGDAPDFGPGAPGGPGRGGRGGFNDAPRLSIKGFADQRRAYLLSYQDEKK